MLVCTQLAEGDVGELFSAIDVFRFPEYDASLRVIRYSSPLQSVDVVSMSSRNARDGLIKSVSSAYSTSRGKVAAAGGRVGRRDQRSCRAASKKSVKITGLRRCR